MSESTKRDRDAHTRSSKQLLTSPQDDLSSTHYNMEKSFPVHPRGRSRTADHYSIPWHAMPTVSSAAKHRRRVSALELVLMLLALQCVWAWYERLTRILNHRQPTRHIPPPPHCTLSQIHRSAAWGIRTWAAWERAQQRLSCLDLTQKQKLRLRLCPYRPALQGFLLLTHPSLQALRRSLHCVTL